jgi:zinc protease
MRSSLFGQTGYGLDALGTEASLQKLQAADLAQFHQQHSVPNNCVLAIYGDIHPQSLLTSVKAAFGDWKPRQSAHCPPPSSPTPTASNLSSSSDSIRRVAEFRDKKQAVIVVGFSGTTLHDPDRYALELLQETCSDLGSRLFLRVREKLGLAYYVGAQNVLGLEPGFIAFYAGTLPEKIGLVEQELLNEAELLRQQGLTEQELHRAKAKIIGQKKIARQELGGYAIITALDELYGLGYAHTDREDALYNSVTLEDVRTVAQKYLNPNAFVIATIAPKD